MKKYTAYLSLIAISSFGIFTPSTELFSDEVSKEEFMALAQRVEQLEASLRVVRNKQVEEIATEAFAAMPANTQDRQFLIDSVVTTIQSREEAASYPWMDVEKWSAIKKGMTPEEVVVVLDKPTLNEPSMHKRVDTVYTYQGRRVATAKKVTGIIRFYKGKVIEIEKPQL